MGILAWVTLLPLVGAALVMLVPREEESVHRGLGIGTALVTFLVSLFILPDFDAAQAGFQLVVDKPWIDSLGIRFHLGVDGISLWLVLLTTFLMPVTLLSPQAIGVRNIRVREFIVAMLVLESGMLGAFVALDLFVFYVFWELMLIPMYFIIGIWGGERRLYASIKFVIYTLVGSLLMLVAILYLYAQYRAATGSFTFDYVALSHLSLPRVPQMLCFAAFALAFAIKVPIFPLHTWLPDAHVEAPTGGSVILAGVLLKFGTYGFLRFALPMFPLAAAEAAPLLAILAVIGIIYGALMAYVQDDAKRLVAYSSVSHLGFVVLGIVTLTEPGVQGAIYQMLAHGISTGGLFLAVGLLYDRRHTRKLADFGGLWAKTPVFAACFLVIVLASVGLPGLCGFVGEFLVLLGIFTADSTWQGTLAGYLPGPKVLAAISASAVILAAMYLLSMYQKLMFGPLDKPENKTVRDIHGVETWVFGTVVVAALAMGIWPKPILDRSEKSVQAFISSYSERLQEARKNPDSPSHIFPPLPAGAVGAGAGVGAAAPGAAPAAAPMPTPTPMPLRRAPVKP
ncbi:MAG TPA: NADH-quinone oxidoreductase subunit M [Polyangia bacterium]|jgi:NADH-quinone oxidoreductase subunit M|nr:NADH-quinone oxidoreductase subunit M [Polyangia bacterium]